MNPYNQRKEPTFGKPSEAEVATENRNETADKVGNVAPQAQPTAPVKANPTATTGENATQSSKTEGQKMAFSLHTKNAPTYTFTPVMKRPAEQAATLSTLEEQAEQTMSNEKAPLAPQSQATPTSSPEKQATAPNGGFAFAPVAESAENAPTATPAVNAQPANAQSDLKAEQATPASLVERVIPAAAAKTAVEKVPSKYRRLAIVILLLLLIILGIWLLKPSTPQSVETLQEQGSSLPIEFRPVDEEEAKRAEAQAKALQEAQAQEAQAQATEAQANATAQNGEQAVASQPLSAQATVSTAQPTAEAQTATAQPVSAQAQSSQVQGGQEQAVKEQTVVAVQKPQTTGSVIYQPETAKMVKTNVTAPKTQETAPVKTQKQPHVEAVKAEAVKPAVVAKPVVKQPMPVPAKVAPAPVAVASKTLTVPKGVSLMQVFRDNNLNISDVNAMSRANGVVSNLKVGEKVTVRLDKNNRVAEMRIGSGGTFIRQANGSYLYK